MWYWPAAPARGFSVKTGTPYRSPSARAFSIATSQAATMRQPGRRAKAGAWKRVAILPQPTIATRNGSWGVLLLIAAQGRNAVAVADGAAQDRVVQLHL